MKTSWLLAAQVALWRYGWIWPVIGLLLLLGLGINQVWLPSLAKQATQLTQDNTRLQSQFQLLRITPASAAPLNTDDLALQALDRVTYGEANISATLRAIYSLASKQGISVAQSEFQTINEGRGGLRQLQVSLPMRASYPQFKVFVNEMLREHPGVSLDQVQIKREAVTQNQPELRVKLSLWIDPRKSDVQREDSAQGKARNKEALK